MIDIISDIIVALCLFALFVAIIINFFEADKKIEKRQRSIVETGSMTAFFVVFYLLIRFKIGYIELGETVKYIIKPLGLFLMMAGCYINVKGRLNLGGNWANQVTIYDKQKLVTTGMYRYVRHPLYASIIGMFYTACLIYSNYLAFIANSVIFIPFMVYRARQEEKLLKERFYDYDEYKKKTGMLFPKL